MKKIVRKNQVIITALAIMIAAAGYFNYAEKNIIKSTGVATKDTEEKETMAEGESAGAAVEDPYNDDELLLSENDILSLDSDAGEESSEAASEAQTEVQVQPESEETTQEPGEAVLTNGTAFSSDVKLNREQLRAKNKEALLEIVNNASVSEAQRQQAVDAMVEMTDNAEKEEAVEMLLEAKGFANAVVSISDGTVDIVMDMTDITDAQRAQIEDIVKRKTGIAPENIVITPLKESEDAEDTTQTDETSADTSYEEDSETSAQPYEDTAIDTTDIYD